MWGIAVGGTILQNELQKRLPIGFIEQFPKGTSVAYEIIPVIHLLEEPLQATVRAAFADSLRVFWEVFIAVSFAGLAASLLMKALPLHTAMDKEWGLKEVVSEEISPSIE